MLGGAKDRAKEKAKREADPDWRPGRVLPMRQARLAGSRSRRREEDWREPVCQPTEASCFERRREVTMAGANRGQKREPVPMVGSGTDPVDVDETRGVDSLAGSRSIGSVSVDPLRDVKVHVDVRVPKTLRLRLAVVGHLLRWMAVLAGRVLHGTVSIDVRLPSDEEDES